MLDSAKRKCQWKTTMTYLSCNIRAPSAMVMQSLQETIVYFAWHFSLGNKEKVILRGDFPGAKQRAWSLSCVLKKRRRGSHPSRVETGASKIHVGRRVFGCFFFRAVFIVYVFYTSLKFSLQIQTNIFIKSEDKKDKSTLIGEGSETGVWNGGSHPRLQTRVRKHRKQERESQRYSFWIQGIEDEFHFSLTMLTHTTNS